MPNMADETAAIRALLQDKLADIETAILSSGGGGGVYQPLDDDLSAIAALTTTAYGRALLELADGAALLAALSLGTAAARNIGTASANVPDIGIADLRYQAISAALAAYATANPSDFGLELVQAAGPGPLQDMAGIYPGSLLQPVDHGGLIAWTVDPTTVTNTLALTSGQIWVHRLISTRSQAVTKIMVACQAAGSGLTAGQNMAAILDAAGNRIAQTGDLSAVWNATGNLTLNLSASVNLYAGYSYYVALLAVGTTPPTLRRANLTNTLIGNFNSPTSAPRFATSAGGKTSIPATNDLSTFVQGQNALFCAIG